MKVVETIQMHPKVKAKVQWNTQIKARGPFHAYSFDAPPMITHLMIEGRIRLYALNTDVLNCQIYEDPNPYRLAITKKIIQDTNEQLTRLAELESRLFA